MARDPNKICSVEERNQRRGSGGGYRYSIFPIETVYKLIKYPSRVVPRNNSSINMDTPARAEESEEPSSPTDKDDDKQSSGDNKVEIFFKAIGSAPILKKKKWKVTQDRSVGSVNTFLRKLLKLDTSESLFLYVNQAFAPSPDQTVENLYSCYGVDGSLLVNYCNSQAWG